jgi:hypothetical protein
VLEGLEHEAREGGKGLWADPQQVPPWEWRRRKSVVKSVGNTWGNGGSRQRKGENLVVAVVVVGSPIQSQLG